MASTDPNRTLIDDLRGRRGWIAAAIAIVAIAVVAVLVLGGDSDSGDGTVTGEPTATGEDDLVALAASVGHAVYWVGPDS